MGVIETIVAFGNSTVYNIFYEIRLNAVGKAVIVAKNTTAASANVATILNVDTRYHIV